VILSIYLIAVSILAVYTTTAASEYGLEKDDLQTQFSYTLTEIHGLVK
jgi:hypothetical protein